MSLEILTSPDLAAVRHGFTTRGGGVSAGPYASLSFNRSQEDPAANVDENLRRLQASAMLRLAPLQALQVHGVHALERRTEHVGAPWVEADVLFSFEPGVCVGVRTADCVPVLLWAPDVGGVAAVHAGWRGTAAGAVGVGVAALVARGADPAAMVAVVGPCIGPCCYEVGEEVVRAVAHDADLLDLVSRPTGGCPHVDLGSANVRQLLAAGLQRAHISRVATCTCCQAARFFSHRRDGARFGLMLAFIEVP